jgi:hypothetical protein
VNLRGRFSGFDWDSRDYVVLKIDDEEGEIGKVQHVHVCEHAKINSDSNRSWASIFAFFFFFFGKILYLLLISLEIPFMLRTGLGVADLGAQGGRP